MSLLLTTTIILFGVIKPRAAALQSHLGLLRPHAHSNRILAPSPSPEDAIDGVLNNSNFDDFGRMIRVDDLRTLKSSPQPQPGLRLIARRDFQPHSVIRAKLPPSNADGQDPFV